jgi:type I phosphodiesterase/nucleotide pyrophosphatase
MLANSMAAAALGAAYVIAIVLYLNPHLPLNPTRLPPLIGTVGLFYVAHLTIIFYILLVLRQLLARELFSPAWVSVGVLVWLTALVSAAGAALMWKNLGTFALVVDAATASALDRGAIVLAAVSVLCVLLAVFRRSMPEALSTHGFSVGVVGWPLTQPAPAVRGFLVSDTYHRVAQTASGLEDAGTVYPPGLQLEAQAAMDSAGDETAAVVAAAITKEARFEAPARIDRAYDRIAQALSRARPPQVTITRYQSLDSIGHYFLRYAVPVEFGDVSDEERRRLGSVLERHYAMIDEAIGRAMVALGPEDLLLVVSGYGMEPLGLGKRLIERVIGDPEISGTHEAAPDGFLMAYGAPVARGRQETRASVVDIVPTILYFLGLPIGRDMDGHARADLFQRSFSEERPITFIPTYDR